MVVVTFSRHESRKNYSAATKSHPHETVSRGDRVDNSASDISEAEATAVVGVSEVLVVQA